MLIVIHPFISFVQIKISARYLGDTLGALLEEVQIRFQQHQQSCFLYLASEVIKVTCPQCVVPTVPMWSLRFLAIGYKIRLHFRARDCIPFLCHVDIQIDCIFLCSWKQRFCVIGTSSDNHVCVILQVFSNDPSCAAYLGNMIGVLFGQTINVLSNIEVCLKFRFDLD